MAQRNSAEGIAIVTGATGGMGSESVKALADAGWDEFLLCDIDADRLEAVAAPWRAAGCKVDVIAGNIADPACPGEIVAALGGRPISAVVHTAGVGPNGGTPAEVLDINYAATIRFVDAIREHMAEGSAAVLIASNSAHFPMPPELQAAARRAKRPEDVAALAPLCPDGTVAYPLSKYGVMQVVQREAAGFGARGARINSISPGATDTAMVASEREHGAKIEDMLVLQPIPRIAQPEEMASIAAFLCSPAASFITAADILADGGMINALVPRD
jgi:NAD(P)-dependent dehydrogenase (short-subunit alcohol dehydrogenase family)